MFIITIIKLLLIALNIFPSRFTNRRVMFFIYMTNLVTHGKQLNKYNINNNRLCYKTDLYFVKHTFLVLLILISKENKVNS